MFGVCPDQSPRGRARPGRIRRDDTRPARAVALLVLVLLCVLGVAMAAGPWVVGAQSKASAGGGWSGTELPSGPDATSAAVLAAASGAALGAVPVRQADAACAHCHAAIVEQYLQTPHALASGRAMDNLVPGSLVQAASGMTYSVSADHDEAWLRYRETGSAAGSASEDDGGMAGDPLLRGGHRLDYYLGSGHLGITYLYSVGNYLMESPVAYYANVARYDMKPGLEGLREAAPAIPMTPECLRCHMSGVEKADAGTQNRYSGAPFATGGISCESCHGDASAHVRSNGNAPVLNPAKLTAARRDSICMNCHLEGDISVEKNGRTALDFRPGDDIAEDLAYFVYGHAGATVRGVSEVEQFATSRCRRVSGDSMSCTNCHDPHFIPAAAERVGYYRGKCLSCHGVGPKGAEFAATHHPENHDCTSCHMPRTMAQNIPHIAWTDHRILARPDEDAGPVGTAGATHFDELLPIFAPPTQAPGAAARDLALAYYAAVMAGHTQDGAQAYPMLTQVFANDANDAQVLNALGTLASMKGDTAEAGRMFEGVLALDQKNSFAATDLAVLEARKGALQQARVLLQPVFDRNEDVPGIAMNLAAVECLQGDGAAARMTLTTALRFNPGSHTLRQRLEKAASCQAPAGP